MSRTINLMIRDDGVATIYDDTYDITIHCESEEEQRKVVELLKSIPSAQPEQRWIPCSERLPKYGEPVLWCNEKGSVFTTAITFVNERGDFAVGKRHRRYSVVAWKPLPEPYKEEE